MLHSVKSKLVSKALSGTKDSKERKNAWFTVITGLQTTLRIVNETAANAGVPGLQTGISSLILVLDAIKVGILYTFSYLPVMLKQKTSQNSEDVEKFAQQIAGLNTFLENMKNRGAFPQAVIERIGRLSTYVALFLQ
jgi:hypothetical protein